MRGVVLEQQALLPRSAERRPVRVRARRSTCPTYPGARRSARARRSVPACHRPQQRQRDRVVAADRRAGARTRRGPRRPPASICAIASRDVERVAGDVAGIGDLLRRRTARRRGRVVGAEQPRSLPHGDAGRTERPAGTSSRCRTGPEDGDVADVDVLAPGETSERRWPREARDDAADRAGRPGSARRVARRSDRRPSRAGC